MTVTESSSPVVSDVLRSVATTFPQWHHLVSASFVPLDVSTDQPDNFRGQMRARVLDELSVVEVTAHQHNVIRTPSLISPSGRPYFKLSLQLSGTGLLIQDNREAALMPGDLAVYDTDRPYTLAFEEKFRCMVLMFPHDIIDLPADAVGQLTAVRMAADAGLGRMISPFLVQLAENLDVLSGASGLRLAHNAVDLVTTMFAAELGMTRESATPQEEQHARIRDFIETHLGDPELAPATIAAAHFISTRHLHNLFHASGTTVASWIRTRRLEHCRRDLRDPVLANRPVGSIALRWGFPDAAHFSRVFRSAFGVSPSTYRST